MPTATLPTPSTHLTTPEFLAAVEAARQAGKLDFYAIREDQDQFSINDGDGNFLLCLKNGDVLYFCDETEQFSRSGKLDQASPAQRKLLLILGTSARHALSGEMHDAIEQMAFELWHPKHRRAAAPLLFRFSEAGITAGREVAVEIVINGQDITDARMSYAGAKAIVAACRASKYPKHADWVSEDEMFLAAIR